MSKFTREFKNGKHIFCKDNSVYMSVLPEDLGEFASCASAALAEQNSRVMDGHAEPAQEACKTCKDAKQVFVGDSESFHASENVEQCPDCSTACGCEMSGESICGKKFQQKESATASFCGNLIVQSGAVFECGHPKACHSTHNTENQGE